MSDKIIIQQNQVFAIPPWYLLKSGGKIVQAHHSGSQPYNFFYFTSDFQITMSDYDVCIWHIKPKSITTKQ